MDLAKKLEGTLGVEEVLYGQGWVENYATVVEKFNLSSWMLV